MEPRILVVDDDLQVRDFLADVLEAWSGVVHRASTLREGLSAVSSQHLDIVFLDVLLPDGSGLDGVQSFRRSPGRPEVVLMTGQGDTYGAALALEHGAWDYLCKPLSVHDVRLILNHIMAFRGSLETQTPVVFTIADFICTTPSMEECLRAAALAASSDMPVLITGETGTGKERLARAIHHNSPRASQPFVVVDCTVLPESLIESHLFGHEKGAFTGADQRRIGLVQLAHHGTLFLDEVGDLPLGVQAKFLRLLHEKTFRPLGAKDEMFSDFRLLAATHQNLEAMVEEGRFRGDLYYRLAGMKITVPPLKDRKEDILPLIQDVLRRESHRSGKELKGLSPDFVEAVLRYPWPGNVRELLHAVHCALGACGKSHLLFATHLPKHVRVHVTASRISSQEAPAFSRPLEQAAKGDVSFELSSFFENRFPAFKEYREKILNRAAVIYLHELRRRCGGDVRKACLMSGLSRSRLYSLMKEAGFQRMDLQD